MKYTSPRVNWLGQNVSGATILDIGFAGGYETASANSSISQHNPNSLVISLDIDDKLVFKHRPPHALVADGYSLPFKDHSIETVVLAEVLEHHIFWQHIVTEASRVISPKGSLVITTPNPYGLFNWTKHWLFSHNPQSHSNIKSYLGAVDHTQFIEPLSLMKFLHHLKFKPSITTTNLSIPYVSKIFKDPPINAWPFNRLGTYTCIKAKKSS